MKKTILNQIKNAVCKYLNVDEDLMFSGFRESRLQDARTYICYLAVQQGVDELFISRYMGYIEARYSTRRYWAVKNHIQNYGNSQVCTDIEKLTEILQIVEPV